MTNKTLEEKIKELKNIKFSPFRGGGKSITLEALKIIHQLQQENKQLKDGLNKIANHFEDHSTIHSQAKTLKRMARTYLNKSLREVAKDNDFEPRTKEEKRTSFELSK